MPKKSYKIVTLPAPVLLGEMRPIKKFDKDILDLAKQMEKDMYKAKGVGLAASQIGLDLKMFVIAYKSGSLCFINPKIYFTSKDTEIEEEGCLSIPGKYMPIKRHTKIKISYFDEHGVEHDIEASGFLARVIQHEYDHINGTLINRRNMELSPEEILKSLTDDDE